MAQENQNGVQYTFTQSAFGMPAVPGNYTFSEGNNGSALPPPPPPIGPEIGPDPRNATATLKLTPHPVILDEASQVRYDFHHGYRIEMPDIAGDYRLRVYDMDAEILMEDLKLKPGQGVVGNLKYFIRFRLSVERDGKLIFLHDFDCTDRKVMVIIPDGALGDNLAWMPYAEAFRVEHHAKVTCVCGEWLIRLVRDQYPKLDFRPIAEKPDAPDYYACYCCAIFPKDRKNWRPSDHQNFGMQGSVAKLLGVQPVPHKVRFKLDAPRIIQEPYVCISAMATNPAKHWNCAGGWDILCRYLKRLGYRVLVIDRDPELTFIGKKYRIPAEAEDWTGLHPISERLELLQHAEFFVGLPSGLSWLAWSANIPVVMLSGFTLDGSEFPTPYRVTNFNFCHGCWNDSNLFFDMTAPVWCPRHKGTPREIECTRAITPKMVIDTVNRIPAVAERLAKKLKQIPEVSIIITSCHGEYLGATLGSIERMLANTDISAEIILYDDASREDKAQFIFSRLEAVYPDILHIYHGKENLGAALGRNEAIKHARGKYLLIFDDDDIMLPFNLRASLDYMEKHPETLLSYAPKYLFSQTRGFLNEIHGAPLSHLEAFFAPKVNINAAIIRKDAVLRLGGFLPVNGDKKEIGEDTALVIRLEQEGEFRFEQEPRCLYRMHDRQLTSAKKQWVNAITEEPCNKHKELYQRILNGDIPDVHGKDFRIVRGLMGAAFFFHQCDRKITTPIIEAAQREFPDDFGAWDIWFYTLIQDGKIEEALKALPAVLERFKACPAVGILFFCPFFLYYQSIGQNLPEKIRDMHDEISRRHLELPEIVKEEFQRLGIRA